MKCYFLLCYLNILNMHVFHPFFPAMIPIYFPSTLEIAFSIQSLWVVVGVAIGFAATSLVIIRTKLYILIGFLVIGLLGYLCTEILRKQKNSRKGEKAAILKSNNWKNQQMLYSLEVISIIISILAYIRAKIFFVPTKTQALYNITVYGIIVGCLHN